MLETLLSPVVLFFVLGAVAALLRSDLAIPEAIGKGISLYLMVAIGLKGGVEVSEAGFTFDLMIAAVAGITLSFLIPVPVFLVLRSVGRLNPVNAAAVSAHYGSVSVVTFVTGLEILTRQQIPAAGYMVAVLALMETPAIISGLLLAQRFGVTGTRPARELMHETLTNGSVMLLVGSFVIGLLVGKSGFASIAPVFEGAFRGVLCLFLLDMGLVAAKRLKDGRSLTPRLIALALAIALTNGTLGVLLGSVLGLDTGTAAALGILAGSASYIAVPAAMRLALPQADPGLYLGMSLAVTFPFNILIGIPIYVWLAQWVVR
ncbi:sodium-dependent bicarbonate transport family permease [Devosia sp. L53-10-65]|uniref:Sodium-dependent bicarbonate transport family permease n=1 Tax=Devosia marina TaxID=2683198 RepID=A0A7X3FRN1_9HYPH|nr:sodium-dependent bicarbonate transport family permease [Devosia marina]